MQVESAPGFESAKAKYFDKMGTSPYFGVFLWRNATFTVGGILSGLVAGDVIVIQNNGGDDLDLTADGAFTFVTPLADGATYAITVATQPPVPSETCNISNGNGTVAGADINNVSITCVVDTFTVGGTVTGLASGTTVELQNNGGDNQLISANGGFTFSAPLADLSGYSVTVISQPDSPVQTCTVLNVISCVTETYMIGGTLAGLAAGDSIEIQNNGGDSLIIPADGVFTFALPLDDGSPYTVTVLNQPPSPSETCIVSQGSGNLTGADVTGVYITCTVNPFIVGGTLTGLAAGATLVLQNNGADDLALNTDGAFSFPAPLDDGTAYTVSVATQPTGQTCSPSNNSGSLTGANVTSVVVDCFGDTNPTPPIPQTPARPVPTMPIWLLWVMAALLVGFSSKRLRRQS